MLDTGRYIKEAISYVRTIARELHAINSNLIIANMISLDRANEVEDKVMMLASRYGIIEDAPDETGEDESSDGASE